MANTIIGRIYRITPTENIATKKGTTFMKRQLIIDASRYDHILVRKSLTISRPLRLEARSCADCLRGIVLMIW